MNAGEADVILLDLGLPDLDGVEVCRHLRRWSSTPIIVLTADGGGGSQGRGAGRGSRRLPDQAVLGARAAGPRAGRAAPPAGAGRPRGRCEIVVGDLEIDVAGPTSRQPGQPARADPQGVRPAHRRWPATPGKLLTYRQARGRGLGQCGPMQPPRRCAPTSRSCARSSGKVRNRPDHRERVRASATAWCFPSRRRCEHPTRSETIEKRRPHNFSNKS